MFWGTLKQELVFHLHFKTRTKAIDAIQEYIEIFIAGYVVIRP
ncbi:MAG: hypothetical protein DRP59_03185 [Spirochaetes bacterium]|nr:MAG: hypothetical protein DRP59_03185 [Spirochaetota bacterium]